jgi:hypothetical protein
VVGCSEDEDNIPAPTLLAGAASESIMPTVAGGRAYLQQAPGWPAAADLDPDNPGVFVAQWDQGRVDVGNGDEDSAWAHSDIRVTAVALARGEQRVVLVSTDTYMHFAADADLMAQQARTLLPEEWQDAEILIAATHNHNGPDTAFSINDDWYQMMADQTALAIADAVASIQPATAVVAAGEHNYGSIDQRDPLIFDNRLNVLAIDAEQSGEPIAVIVQWAAHPEVTLGWEPPADAADLDTACAIKGWVGDDCSAEGRYLTADFPGVLQTRLKASRGGEVLFFNGAVGNQVGPGDAPNWVIDEQHPIGDGKTVPPGAEPLTQCDDRPNPYLCRTMAKTESTGNELARAVSALLANASSVDISELTVRRQVFYSRLTNIGFRVLLANGTLGWQQADAYTCTEKPFTDANCTNVGAAVEDDPVLAVLGEQIITGDVFRSRLTHLDLGDVGMLFMPGEIPPELVVGLPADFNTAPADRYYSEPELHAVGADYVIPGHLLSLTEEPITFTVGLGTDTLGYWVPVDEYRLLCSDLIQGLVGAASCEDLHARGIIEGPDWIGGRTCKNITDDPDQYLLPLGADANAVAAICRYGQMAGAEFGEPRGHYEETNAAGWDLVDDLWNAAQELFARQ